MRSVLDLSDTTVVAGSELGMPTKLSLWFAGSYNLLEINLTRLFQKGRTRSGEAAVKSNRSRCVKYSDLNE
jgi:hypothetical protein